MPLNAEDASSQRCVLNIFSAPFFSSVSNHGFTLSHNNKIFLSLIWLRTKSNEITQWYFLFQKPSCCSLNRNLFSLRLLLEKEKRKNFGIILTRVFFSLILNFLFKKTPRKAYKFCLKIHAQHRKKFKRFTLKHDFQIVF